ncbi:MAG: LapA family protein [Leptospira sp.]|nr:LapA family protein [Leptospira sp.]
MTSVRVNLIIGSIIFLFLSLVGNSEPVEFDILWLSFHIPLFAIMILYVGFGAFLSFLFTGHIKYLKRIRDRFNS